MATKVMRGSPFYWNGKKLGTVNKGSFNDNGNVAQEITSEGFVGNSLGARVTDGDFDCSIFIDDPSHVALQPQESGKLGFVSAGNKQYVVDATINAAKHTTDHAAGKSHVNFSWTGGPPDIS